MDENVNECFCINSQMDAGHAMCKGKMLFPWSILIILLQKNCFLSASSWPSMDVNCSLSIELVVPKGFHFTPNLIVSYGSSQQE